LCLCAVGVCSGLQLCLAVARAVTHVVKGLWYGWYHSVEGVVLSAADYAAGRMGLTVVVGLLSGMQLPARALCTPAVSVLCSSHTQDTGVAATAPYHCITVARYIGSVQLHASCFPASSGQVACQHKWLSATCRTACRHRQTHHQAAIQNHSCCCSNAMHATLVPLVGVVGFRLDASVAIRAEQGVPVVNLAGNKWGFCCSRHCLVST